MFNTQSHTLFGSSIAQSHFPSTDSKPSNLFLLNSSNRSNIMWRNISQRLCSRDPVSSSLNRLQSIHSEKLTIRGMNFDCCSSIKAYPEQKVFEFGHIVATEERIGGFNVKRFASVAEAVVVSSSSTDADEEVNGGDEVKKLLDEMGKQERRQAIRGWWRQKREKTGSNWNYLKLKRRQVKIETEAWEQAANEYKELLSDMCEKKLAPNLPYMKSLFLGWFEPLCKKIDHDQELCRQRKLKTAYAPYFDLLPADKMAVITMHKIMGLIMTGGENGCARVVSASCSVGEAIEQEIRIHNFLEKTRTKKASKDVKEEEKYIDAASKEQEGLQKKVTNLMKKKKLQVVGHIMKGHDDSKPWSQPVKAQVGSRLIELLLQSAYIQPPLDQLGGDMPPDIRPAFVHTLRTSVKDGQYGFILPLGGGKMDHWDGTKWVGLTCQ